MTGGTVSSILARRAGFSRLAGRVVSQRYWDYDNPMADGNVLITGASTGIGQACALALDRLGFRVFAGIRKFTDGEALRAKSSGQLTPVTLDVTSLESIQAAIKLIGSVPIVGLVNNAGIVVSGP